MIERNFEKIKGNNFILIPGWAVKEFKLKGNELIIYSCIYGFSQEIGTYFTGSCQYLADWTCSSLESVRLILKKLVDSELIIKHKDGLNVKYNVNYSKLPIAK